MKSDYYERKERRIARYSYLAAKAAHESEQRFKIADKMASCIPMGQPILIGHYSEQRDRNFRKKIENNFRYSSRRRTRGQFPRVREGINRDDL